MKLKDIARIVGREVVTVKPDAALSEAIGKLVNHKIGALPVCDFKGKLVGIVSERDILKWIHRGNIETGNTRVRDVMTREVILGDPEDDIENILKAMTEKGVRHLPVMSGGAVVGILSLRDVIEEQLTECSSQIRYLHDYIAGGTA
jgi:CBS domain-containing protein